MASERKHWWLTNRNIVDKYLTDARSLLAMQEPSDVAAALGLVEAALGLSPRTESALELKARCLLSLRRFRDVADMLQDYIPSYRLPSPDDDSDTSLSSSNSKERGKLLPSRNDRSSSNNSSGCFSVSDLKHKVMAGLCSNSNQEGQKKYLVLGQGCFHLGMMEDAMVLLQTGRRLAAVEFLRKSVGFSDDTFTSSSSHVLTHIKLLLRRHAAAIAALDARIPTEAIGHFMKILDCRRGTRPKPGTRRVPCGYQPPRVYVKPSAVTCTFKKHAFFDVRARKPCTARRSRRLPTESSIEITSRSVDSAT